MRMGFIGVKIDNTHAKRHVNSFIFNDSMGKRSTETSKRYDVSKTRRAYYSTPCLGYIITYWPRAFVLDMRKFTRKPSGIYGF